jgi:hypothetical protein
MLRKDRVIIDWSTSTEFVTVCYSLESISQLDENFFFVGILPAPSDVNFLRR